MVNRRYFLQGCAGWFAAAMSATGADASSVRRYRADATVTFLGIPIFSRAGVGSCSIGVEQATGKVVLRFQAGSVPERSRGLNRLGYIQETVEERGNDAASSVYFGFITSSGEESLDQAKAALGGNGKDAVPYTAVEGSATAASSSYRLYQMKLPPTYNFTHCDDVVRRVRESIGRNEIPAARQETVTADTPRTFLYALRLAIVSGRPRTTLPFLYNGKRYRLDAQTSSDRKMGEQFASRKLVSSAHKVQRLNGTIENLAKRDKTTFRLWFEQGQQLPVRFEYKAKSYLNLAFEQA